jgi:guanylate kinase
VSRLVILYGPPAAGKTTITAAIERQDPRFRLFPRLKCGEGRCSEYRMITENELDKLRAQGDVIWENERYAATYVTDRGYLARMLDEGLIPVVHAGQAEAVAAIAKALPDTRIISVGLVCPRPVAASRIEKRATGDTHQRLSAFDATPPLPDADIEIDTSVVPAEAAAERVIRACLNGEGSGA